MMRVEWRSHAALPGAKLKRVSVVRSYFDLHGVYFFLSYTLCPTKE
jgi:hypothetical protein